MGNVEVSRTLLSLLTPSNHHLPLAPQDPTENISYNTTIGLDPNGPPTFASGSNIPNGLFSALRVAGKNDSSSESAGIGRGGRVMFSGSAFRDLSLDVMNI